MARPNARFVTEIDDVVVIDEDTAVERLREVSRKVDRLAKKHQREDTDEEASRDTVTASRASNEEDLF